MKIQFSQLTDVGCVRQANEDNMGHLNLPDGEVYVVCDGMGGHVGGATASSLAVKSILEYFSRANENPSIAILKAIEFANEQIFASAQAKPELKGMGTTITLVLRKGNDFHIGHVGDSRIYLRTDGVLHRLTRDHSFVQGLVENNIISDADAESHPRKNELTRALGIRAQVEPTISSNPIQLKEKDTLMLCSDGLCGVVNDLTLNSIIAAATTTDEAAVKLIEAARNGGGPDNITAQLIHIEESPYSNTSFVDYSPKDQLTSSHGYSPSANGPANAHQEKSTSSKKLIYSSVILAVLLVGVALYKFMDVGSGDKTNGSPGNNTTSGSSTTTTTTGGGNPPDGKTPPTHPILKQPFLVVRFQEANNYELFKPGEKGNVFKFKKNDWKSLLSDLANKSKLPFALCSEYAYVYTKTTTTTLCEFKKTNAVPLNKKDIWIKMDSIVFYNKEEHDNHQNDCCESLRGPVGPTGAQGSSGSSGSTGTSGSSGSSGSSGTSGSSGSSGSSGTSGSSGSSGSSGTSGSSGSQKGTAGSAGNTGGTQ